MMHDTYDMKIDTWKVTTAGNGEEEKIFNLLNLKRSATENSERNSGEHPGVGTTAWQHPPPHHQNLEHTDSVDMMPLNVLHDLPFSWNHPLNSAHDWYTEI